MGQVIIHAGFHKTATTSIQKTCAKNRKQLEKLGFYYPLFYLNETLFDNHSALFYSMFTSNPERYHVNVNWKVDVNEANKKYEQQLNELLQKKLNKIVISGEDISVLTKSELSRMKEKIYSYGYSIRLIILVRSPFSSLNSFIQQQIKSGRSIEKANCQSTKNRIENIISVFPEAEFYSFQKSCKHNYGPIGYFLNLIGVNNYSEIDFFDSNTSISNQSARLISYINERHPLWINEKVNSLVSHNQISLFNKIKGSKFKLTSNEIEKFRHILDKDNEYLSEKFSIDFCDPKPYLTLEENQKNYWSREQLEQLKIAIYKIDHNLVVKEIIRDYFKNIVKLNQQTISYLGLTS